ncbi:MAG: glycosyltransferase [Caldisericum exile]|uniref:glycosyltransferase n=1 Tax=Caldisericum exile TaxID=693075 RepID=UPI003C71CFE5
MKIKTAVLINSLRSGGAEKVVSVILNELAIEYSDKIELICLEKNNFYEIDKRIKITYLSDFTGKESGIKKLLYLPIFAWRLKKYIKRNNISLVQSHIFRANYVNILAKLLGGLYKIQIVIPGLVSFYKNEKLVGKINLFLIRHLYKRADLIICKSKGMLIDMQELFNFKNKSIVINNPYDIEKIERLSQEVVDDFRFESDKIYLVSVGRLESFKKQEEIIKALSYLNSNIQLLLIGEGEKREFLENIVNNLGLKDRVHFLGKKANPFKYLNKCNIYILSSCDGEGFPNVIVEAMICGLPVVSTDCKSGPREILAPNTDVTFQVKSGVEWAEYGCLVPVGGVAEIKEAVEKLLADDILRNKYIQKGKERAKDFSLDKIIAKYKEVLGL